MAELRRAASEKAVLVEQLEAVTATTEEQQQCACKLQLELNATQGVVSELQQVEQKHVELQKEHTQLSDNLKSLEASKAATEQDLKVVPHNGRVSQSVSQS